MNLADAPHCKIEEHQAGGAAEAPRVRLYVPPRPDGSLLLYMHGGGFVQGDLDRVDPQCRKLAVLTGAHVASLRYRLAPEHPFPAAPNDVVTLIKWVVENAPRFGFDLDRVAIAGESSGGNLAAVLSAHLADHGPFRPRGQVLIYPVTDLRCNKDSYAANAITPTLTASRMRWYVEKYLATPHDALDPRASPLLAQDMSDLPPTLLVVAGRDPLADDGRAYARRLKEAAVEVTVLEFPELYHGFWGWGRHLSAARELIELVGSFIRNVTSERDGPNF
jgi:acetyl esterase